MKMIQMSMVVIATLVVSAQATTMTLTNSGSWFVEGNWSNGVPTSADEAVVASAKTVTADSAGGVASIVKVGGSGVVTVNIDGAIVVSGATWLGNGNNNTGTLNINGGTYSDSGVLVGYNNGAQGFVNISNGTYTASGNIILGRGRGNAYGELNVSGGHFNATNQIVYVGYDRVQSAVINITGGQFTTGSLQNRANALSDSVYDINISGGIVTSSAWDFSYTSSVGALNINGSSSGINVSGNVTLSSNLTFNVALNAGGISPIKVGGAANLNSSPLKVTLLDGLTYNDVGGTHKLIDAASLTGTFASVDITAFDGKAELVYDTANGDVLLKVEKNAQGTVILVH